MKSRSRTESQSHMLALRTRCGYQEPTVRTVGCSAIPYVPSYRYDLLLPGPILVLLIALIHVRSPLYLAKIPLLPVRRY